MEQIEEGTREVRAIGGSASGQLTVGLFSSLASGFLARLFHAYDDRYRGVQVDFVDASAREHSMSVRQLETDVAFTIGRLNVHDCDAVHLWTESLSVALPVSHPLAPKEQLSWSDLADEVFLVRPGALGLEVRDYIVGRLEELNMRATIKVQRVGRYSLLGLVAARRGIALVIQSETTISIPGVVYRPIAEERLPFFMIFSARNDNPAARVLISLARKMSQETA